MLNTAQLALQASAQNPPSDPAFMPQVADELALVRKLRSIRRQLRDLQTPPQDSRH